MVATVVVVAVGPRRLPGEEVFLARVNVEVRPELVRRARLLHAPPAVGHQLEGGELLAVFLPFGGRGALPGPVAGGAVDPTVVAVRLALDIVAYLDAERVCECRRELRLGWGQL